MLSCPLPYSLCPDIVEVALSVPPVRIANAVVMATYLLCPGLHSILVQTDVPLLQKQVLHPSAPM